MDIDIGIGIYIDFGIDVGSGIGIDIYVGIDVTKSATVYRTRFVH